MQHLKIKVALTGLFMSAIVLAQTQNDVILKFNEGADNVHKGEYALAITAFEEVISMASTVGAEADNLAGKAKEQLPTMNYQLAVGYIKQKDYVNAIPYLEKTVNLANEYNNNEDVKSRSVKFLYQLLTVIGSQNNKDGDSKTALENFDKALTYMPEYPKAFLGKGLIYYEENKEDEMLEAFGKAIEYGKSLDDPKAVELAQETLARFYVNRGDAELSKLDPAAEDFTSIIPAYEKAIKYNPANTMANYKLALIHNRLIEYDKAIEYAKKALETATAEMEIAAINFELGEAYSGTVEYDLACEAYSKAAVGALEEKAAARKERIKCN